MSAQFETILDGFVFGTIMRSQGAIKNPYDMARFIHCRKAIKEGLDSVEWIMFGLDTYVINVVMQTGDQFFARGKTKIALNFFKEACHFWPSSAVCFIREAQCHVMLKSFDLAISPLRKAIRLSDVDEFDELCATIDKYIDIGKLKEAHAFYSTLAERFPRIPHFSAKVREINRSLQRSRQVGKTTSAEKKVKKNLTKASSGETNVRGCASLNIGQTRNERLTKRSDEKLKERDKDVGGTSDETNKLDEATGGIEQNVETVVLPKPVPEPPKVVKKTKKQLIREQMKREEEIKKEIEKASKEQEEKFKKQQELEARKKKEREEKAEEFRKILADEAERRKEEEKHKRKLERAKKEEIKKKQTSNKRAQKGSSKSSSGSKDVDASNMKTTKVKDPQSTLNDMSTDFDHVLRSKSRLRRVCPTCNTPRVFSMSLGARCHSCKSEMVVWYRKINTTNWVKPRKPPDGVSGAYLQCKHYAQGKTCVKMPCRFAHGQDEVEIWELFRSKGMKPPKQPQTSTAWTSTTTHAAWYPAKEVPETTNGRHSRTDSLSLHHSNQSFSSPYDVSSSGDWQTAESESEDFDSNSEYSSFFFSQDTFNESSQGSTAQFASLFSPDQVQDDVGLTGEDFVQNNEELLSETTRGDEGGDDKGNVEDLGGWSTVGGSTKFQIGLSTGLEKKLKESSFAFESRPSSQFTNTISFVMGQEKLRCRFCDIIFPSQLELEHHYSDAQHRVNVIRFSQNLHTKSATKFRPPPDGVYMGRYKVCRRFEEGYCYLEKNCTFAHGQEERDYWEALYHKQTCHLTQLEEKQLLKEGYSEKVRRRIKLEGPHRVLQQELPGVTVSCDSGWKLKLLKVDGPQVDHTWIIDVRIQRMHQLPLNQVAFLFETHLDKFKFLRRSGKQRQSLNLQSVHFREEDFVEDIARNESAVQFCVQFSSGVFGDFEQKLVFDFGKDNVLARPLFVSVVSKDNSKEKSSSRSTYCRIAEWSMEQVELVLCKQLVELDSDGLCQQYSIPNDSSVPENCSFTRGTYCDLWHKILFIEEQHIQEAVARYDIQDGEMKVVNTFASAESTVFAAPGEFFGEIYLSDYLVMDEVAGHIITRSVMSVVLRLKMGKSHSKKVYECYIQSKTSQFVVIKLNEMLCKDYRFSKDQVVQIDLKFRYNRLPLCEMHEAVDMCKHKTDILLPNVKNVSYKYKRSISDWFMDRKPNDNQHEAIAMILDPNPTPPILVIGPFGTGKTFTLSLACMSILSQPGRYKVLICTNSNSAADIHLEYLHEKIKEKPSLRIRPMRVLPLYRNIRTVPPELRRYCNIKADEIRESTWNDIRDNNVIITTLATARVLWKFYQNGKLHLTHILVDEAAQALESKCLIPLAIADKNTKIVLAGDHKQMGARAFSKWLWPEEFGPERSLLQRLFAHYERDYKSTYESSSLSQQANNDTTHVGTPYVVLLSENYRCHEKILKFPSDCFYGGELVASGDQSTLDNKPVLSFYTAQGVDQRVEEGLAYYNDAEVDEVVARVKELVDILPKDWPAKSIGVLTPYRDQVKRIREGLRKSRLRDVDVETVENVQGKEFKALFISTVRTMWTCSVIEGRNSDPSELDFGFLSDPRFLNTAVTRAQSLLAVVGDPMSLCSVGACRDLWKDYLRRCEENEGLHGCTLKTVMDFCLRSQPLDPSAHEFTPSVVANNRKQDTSKSTSSKGEENIVASGRTVSETDMNNATATSSYDAQPSSSTTMPSQDIKPASQPDVDSLDGNESTEVDSGGDLLGNDENHDDNRAIDEGQNEDEDDSGINQYTTDEFFRRDDDDNYDRIITELIKACRKTKEKDEDKQKVTSNEFPALNDVDLFPKTSAPSWPVKSMNRTFSAGLRDGKIELGFHVKDSDRLVRLTGGRMTFKESGDRESSHHDIDEFPREELLKLLQGNQTRFTKCCFRTDNSSRPPRHYGHLPTPDSPDIHIPGRARGVYEDDVVVLELQPRATLRSGDGREQETLYVGYIRGVLRQLVKPKERQFVCTVDRTNPGMMVPINKNVPKLMNFTKTDVEGIIPIYTMEGSKVVRASILKGKPYNAALAGERLFVLKLLQWRKNCPTPLGYAIRHIPHGKDFRTGMDVLYEEHNIKKEFHREIRDTVQKKFSENWQVPPSERGRPAYRENVFTIDPPESRDLDDAISLRSLGNGNYELRIHIADVSFFVLPNTNLDKEAMLRGTSYYPPKPDENVPMLPRRLSENCCSLLEGKDRLVLTVKVEVTSDGRVIGDAKMERSVICSSSRLSYLEAQQIIDDSSETDVATNLEAKEIPVNEAIGIVHRFAKGYRRSRLGLERSMYYRKSDDDDDDDDDGNDDDDDQDNDHEGGGNEREAHQMIEEVMVLANHLVAKYLLNRFPECTPLRVQPPPKMRKVVEWRKRFQKFLSVSFGLGWREDTNSVVHDENIDLMVPFQTWNAIMSEVRSGSNLQDLVKVICDLDLFPQLSLANMHQQQIQQRGSYICSGDDFGNIPYPWPKHGEASVNIPRAANIENSSENLETNTTDGIPSSNAYFDSSPNLQSDSASLKQDKTPVAVDTTNHENDTTNRAAQCSSDADNLRIVLKGHSSLCLDAYCHFTSPIRRYIDIIVHRLVVASLESKRNVMDPEDVTTICDRSTFLTRNSSRFDREAKKLKLAVKLKSSSKFVSAYIDEITPDSLNLFFGPGKMERLRNKSLRIARLGPDKDPKPEGDGIALHWKFRLLRIDKQGTAQPKPDFPDDEKSQELEKTIENQPEDEDPSYTDEVADDDFDYTVSGKQWSAVLNAVKNENEDELKARLKELDDDVQIQAPHRSATKVSLLKRLETDPEPDPNLRNPFYQHPNTGKPEPSEKETDGFYEVTKSFRPYERVKVQICPQMTRGVLSPAIQLFKLTDQIHACVEHRSFPTTCFAKTSHRRPNKTAKFSDIENYVRLWKPVLMMEIATSAVRENNVITLSNLRVNFARVETSGLVTMNFDLSLEYCDNHFLEPLDLNLLCVRVKIPEKKSGKDAGFWVGHFQISEELRRKKDVKDILEEALEKRGTKESEDNLAGEDEPESTISAPKTSTQKAKKINEKFNSKAKYKKSEEYRPVLARLIHSSSPIPEAILAELFCYVTVELIFLNIPDRRRLGALVDSVVATELVQNICTGEDTAEFDDGGQLPSKDLTLPGFNPLNRYQHQAVEQALTKAFTLIQGPPGTGKTVTGVHIAYWFAQMNKKRTPSVGRDGEECNGFMVFYCGPSNKSVDVVARYLLKINGLKILRVYGQEIERKVFPVPEKIIEFRSRHVAAQLKADEDLQNVSLHHVIRSDECPFAEELRGYDQDFKELIKLKLNAPRRMIRQFNKLKEKAEKWAITQSGVEVILSTCTSTYSNRILSSCEGFVTQCIIDECGMCIEAETLCGMLGSDANQVVLIGDHKQLQPIIQCEKAKDLGLGISMFERYSKSAHMLEIQYRMHEELCQFPSKFFYEDKLKTAPEVKNRETDKVTWPNGDRYPFVFHHVEGVEESLVVSTEQGNERSQKNQKEVAKTVFVARRLVGEGVDCKNIVILSPYRAQCSEISNKLKEHNLKDIFVSSVVAAQGSERDYVILSLVRSLPFREIERDASRSWLKEHLGFLTDEHQINVALTRAKRGLCIIGNANLVGVCSLWRALLDHYEKKSCLIMDADK